MGGLFGGGSSYTPSPTPSTVPEATTVSTASDSQGIMSSMMERERKRRGYASTVKTQQQAGAVTGAGSSAGKTKLGE